ncbi:hypothetical protein KAW18_11100 [candidate division WOR-3 bacterium]|nr:hypothetical protein [candidate division WOR-3 bacterium]
MDIDMLSFTKVQINQDLLDEIWKFDPRRLDELKGSILSSYSMALAQYLIYFTYQRNIVKADVYRLNKMIDRTISLILSKDKKLLKEHKTRSSAVDFLVSTNDYLTETQSKLDVLNIELMHIDGVDKSISELIATIKRELTRREKELFTTRMERK